VLVICLLEVSLPIDIPRESNLTTTFSGSISADTNLLESPASPAFSAQPAFDNSGYYSTYPSASGYDYDAGYPVQALGEQDRWVQIY